MVGLELRLISNIDSLQALENAWENILDRVDNPSIALTPQWINTWWNSLGENQNRKLNVLVGLEHSIPIAIFPFYWCKKRYRGFPVKKISFMVDGITPHADFIIAKGLREKAIHLLLKYLSSQKLKWDVVVLDKFRDNCNRKCLINSLKLYDFNYVVQPSLRTPVISVDKSWPLFWSQRSLKFRKSIRHKLNRAQRTLSITVHKIGTQKELLEALPSIFRVSSLSWKGKINRAITDNPVETQFYKTFTKLGIRKGWIHIWLLKYNGEPIAYEYHLTYKNTIYPLRADYDENYRRLSPGSLLEYSIIKDLSKKNNHHTYYSCANDYQYLMNWTDSLEKLCKIYIFNNRLISNFLFKGEYLFLHHLRKIKPLRKIKDLFISRGLNEPKGNH